MKDEIAQLNAQVKTLNQENVYLKQLLEQHNIAYSKESKITWPSNNKKQRQIIIL